MLVDKMLTIVSRELIPEGHSAGFNIYEDMPDNSE